MNVLRKLRESKKLVLILGVVIFVVLGYLSSKISPSLAAKEVTKCGPAPFPYEEVVDKFATDDEGNLFFISKAVVGNGKKWETEGRTSFTFPTCWSNEESLKVVANLFVTLVEGERVFIVIGLVGRESVPLQETPPAP